MCQSEGGRNLTFADFTGYVYYLESGGGGATRVKEYSLVSASPPRGQESGLISGRHQTRLSLHTPRARGSPRLREETCQSHSDVRCDCNAFATDVPPPPSFPQHIQRCRKGGCSTSGRAEPQKLPVQAVISSARSEIKAEAQVCEF